MAIERIEAHARYRALRIGWVMHLKLPKPAPRYWVRCFGILVFDIVLWSERLPNPHLADFVSEEYDVLGLEVTQ